MNNEAVFNFCRTSPLTQIPSYSFVQKLEGGQYFYRPPWFPYFLYLVVGVETNEFVVRRSSGLRIPNCSSRASIALGVL